MYNNVVMNIGVLLELAIMCLIVYVPGVQNVFGSASVPGVYWAFSLISLVAFAVFNELRKLAIRNAPQHPVTRFLTW
jgi:sodium/potassium-transporting ATPase subunit alpha